MFCDASTVSWPWQEPVIRQRTKGKGRDPYDHRPAVAPFLCHIVRTTWPATMISTWTCVRSIRGSRRGQIDAPHRRMYFHDSSSTSAEHEIADVNVVEAVPWAELEYRSRTFALYACVPGDGLA
jgi:hypothetical protein